MLLWPTLAHSMTEDTPEEAARVHAQALVDSDIGTAFLGMTPEGLASAMEIGNTTWNILSFEVATSTPDGDDAVIDIAYFTDLGRDELRYRFRLVDGAWKVVHIEPKS